MLFSTISSVANLIHSELGALFSMSQKNMTTEFQIYFHSGTVQSFTIATYSRECVLMIVSQYFLQQLVVIVTLPGTYSYIITNERVRGRLEQIRVSRLCISDEAQLCAILQVHTHLHHTVHPIIHFFSNIISNNVVALPKPTHSSIYQYTLYSVTYALVIIDFL